MGSVVPSQWFQKSNTFRALNKSNGDADSLLDLLDVLVCSPRLVQRRTLREVIRSIADVYVEMCLEISWIRLVLKFDSIP